MIVTTTVVIDVVLSIFTDKVPSSVLKVVYPGSEANLGNTIAPSKVKAVPNVTWNADPSKLHLLIMIGSFFKAN